MSGDHDKYHGTAEVVNDNFVWVRSEEFIEMLEAFEEAVYLLCPTDEDMQKKAGVYRVVTALDKFTKNRPAARKREWVGLTKKEIDSISERVKPDPLMTEEPTWHIRFAQALQRKIKELNQ